MQLKAETHLLADVVERLKKVASVMPRGQEQRDFHQAREELLEFLLLNEQTRLLVWLFPLDHGTKFFFASKRRHIDPSEVGDAFDLRLKTILTSLGTYCVYVPDCLV